MWSFSTFKDKRYWILLIASIFLLILFALFTPDYILQRPIVVLSAIPVSGIIFWSTYHLWKYLGDEKEERAEDGREI